MKNVYHYEDHNSLFFHKFFLDSLVPLLFKIGVKSNDKPEGILNITREFLETKIGIDAKIHGLKETTKKQNRTDVILELNDK